MPFPYTVHFSFQIAGCSIKKGKCSKKEGHDIEPGQVEAKDAGIAVKGAHNSQKPCTDAKRAGWQQSLFASVKEEASRNTPDESREIKHFQMFPGGLTDR